MSWSVMPGANRIAKLPLTTFHSMRHWKSRPSAAPDLVAVDDALNALAAFDPRKSQIVELRFFGGLSVEETAEVFQVAPNTVMREWNKAKAWLYDERSAKKG